MKYLMMMLLVLSMVALSGRAVAEELSYSRNKILLISEDGIYPERLQLDQSGSSVFFLNETNLSLISIDIDYGDRRGFCATGNMTMLENGHFISVKPVSPRNFITACFPDPGSYNVTVFGVPGHGKGSRATVVVQADKNGELQK